MQQGHNTIRSVIAAAVIILAATGTITADKVIIKGQVIGDFQIVDASGQSYDVAESDVADALLAKATGREVEVTGILEESAGIRTLTVESFTIVGK